MEAAATEATATAETMTETTRSSSTATAAAVRGGIAGGAATGRPCTGITAATIIGIGRIIGVINGRRVSGNFTDITILTIIIPASTRRLP